MAASLQVLPPLITELLVIKMIHHLWPIKVAYLCVAQLSISANFSELTQPTMRKAEHHFLVTEQVV